MFTDSTRPPDSAGHLLNVFLYGHKEQTAVKSCMHKLRQTLSPTRTCVFNKTCTITSFLKFSRSKMNESVSEFNTLPRDLLKILYKRTTLW